MTAAITPLLFAWGRFAWGRFAWGRFGGDPRQHDTALLCFFSLFFTFFLIIYTLLSFLENSGRLTWERLHADDDDPTCTKT